jgi:LPXTG-motif cell wall-anchored protein
MKHILTSLAAVALSMAPAIADEAPQTAAASSSWMAITIFAVVIGMIAGIVIWRRRR